VTPVAVVDLEISNPIPPQADLGRYARACVLLRLHGRPVGVVSAPVARGQLDFDHVYRELLEHKSWTIAAPLAERALALGRAPSWPDVGAMLECKPNTLSCTPRVTVVARPAQAVGTLEYPNLEVQETDRGAGDIVVMVPDGVTLDRGWVGAAVRVFIADPEVTAVAGLTLPREAKAQLEPLLERRWHRAALPANFPGPVAVWRPAVDPSLTHTVVYEPAALAWHRSRLVSDPFATAAAAALPVVRQIDLGATPRSIADATKDAAVLVDVAWDGQPIGQVAIAHEGAILSPFRIHDAIARTLAANVLDARLQLGPAAVRAIVTSELARHLVSVRARAERASACPQWIAPRPAAA
jgi:hypothetical protein